MKFLLIFLLFAIISTANASGWIQKADFGGEARHRTTAFSIGNKGYMGLGHYNGTGLNVLFGDWWEYDPSTNAWTQKADYLGGVTYHAAGFAIGNYGYVGTGRIQSTQLVQTFYRYDPTTNSWLQIANFPGAARRGAVSFVVDGLGYVGTGETNSGRSKDFYRYNPVTNSWNVITPLTGLPRTTSVSFSIGIFGYVGTGNTTSGSSTDFWRYNTLTNTWEQRANVGGPNRQEAVAFSLNGKGYIGTGDDFSSGNNFGDMWEYNVSLNQWTQLGDFEGTARRYLSAFTLNGYAYVGLGTNGTNFQDFWMFDQYLSLLENNLDEIGINIYPNPASENLTIDINWAENLPKENIRFEIISMLGEKIYYEKISEDMTTIKLNDLQNGRYIYSLMYKEEQLKTGQIVITK